MKKFTATLLLAVGITAVGVAAPASAATIGSASGSNIVSPLNYWPNPR